MTKTWYNRTVVASMFQNFISQNTKCTIRDGFHRYSYKYLWSELNNIMHAYIITISYDCWHHLDVNGFAVTLIYKYCI